MDLKKSPRYDLENLRSTFLQIGLVAALALSLIAFEWNTADYSSGDYYYGVEIDVPTEIVPVATVYEREKPVLPKTVDFVIVPDVSEEIIEPWETFTTDLGPNSTIDVPTYELPEDPRDDIHIVVEIMPSFPGGESALFQYLSSNIRYPQAAIDRDLEGRVYVEFVVDRSGKVTNAKVKKGIHPTLDAEALRVVESMPDWSPGIQNGEFVRVMFTIPVLFKLARY